MSTSAELAALYRRDLARLFQEIDAFRDGKNLWDTVPGVSNSAGNLALHLEGNLREYIGRQLCAVTYTRDRPAEFALDNIPHAELARRTADLGRQIPALIETLSESALALPYPENILGQALSVRQFLVHLYGHLNWHLGQIDYLRRVLTGQAALALTGL
jgi:hypothetical protein